MTRVLVAVAAVAFAAGCSNALDPRPGALMPAHGDTVGLEGLERLGRTGAFESGAEEQFRLHVDPSVISRVEWSASAGSLTTSGTLATWKLPRTSTASLELTLHRRDGSVGTSSWSFTLLPSVDPNRPMTAQAALLTTPMPVLDGGSLEISGGACEVRYEGTTSNVAIAFTTATHPALMYGRWNGATWNLEVVDAMGFNTGGQVSQYVSMQVEAGGTPHLAYVRDSQVWYATKSGGTWVRERVDAVGQAYVGSSIIGSSRAETSAPSIALAGTTPSILYASGVSSAYRAAVAVRTGPNAWTRTLVGAGTTGLGSVYPMGELVIDPAGRHLFATEDYTPSIAPYSRLVAWTATATSYLTPPNAYDTRGDAVLVGGNRLLVRTAAGLYDVALNSTFSASTQTWSSVEVNGPYVGDVEWNAATGRPVLLHSHGGNIELVTPNANGFWTYSQLGASSGVSAGLAVHPTSGEVSICYQTNGRVMFQ